MLDFAQSCILIAAIFAALSIDRYRSISLVILINFVFIKVASELRPFYEHGILPLYTHQTICTVIIGLTIVALSKLKAPAPFCVLMFVYSLYSLAIVLEFKWGAIGFHENYIPFARSWMIIELTIMFSMSKWGGYVYTKFKPNRDYDLFIGRFFTCGARLGSEGVA